MGEDSYVEEAHYYIAQTRPAAVLAAGAAPEYLEEGCSSMAALDLAEVLRMKEA
jgi:hypothetical protein